MSERKFYIVTLLLGYSFTAAGGRTFYQNRSARVDLDDEDIERMRGMEGGRKFRIVDAAEEDARLAPGPVPDAKPHAGSVIDIASSKPPVGKVEPTVEKPKREAVLDDEPFDIEDGDEPTDEPAVALPDPVIEAMTVAELRAYLDDRKIVYPPTAKKADLVKLASR